MTVRHVNKTKKKLDEVISVKGGTAKTESSSVCACLCVVRVDVIGYIILHTDQTRARVDPSLIPRAWFSYMLKMQAQGGVLLSVTNPVSRRGDDNFLHVRQPQMWA